MISISCLYNYYCTAQYLLHCPKLRIVTKPNAPFTSTIYKKYASNKKPLYAVRFK